VTTLNDSHESTPVDVAGLGKMAELVKNIGVPIVAMIVLGWFSWETINWERERMLPAIERNNILMERNSQLMEVLIVRIDAQPTTTSKATIKEEAK
jgi:hypothetical protein